MVYGTHIVLKGLSRRTKTPNKLSRDSTNYPSCRLAKNTALTYI
jgi:hypothetical protein